jgi:hypothetical protein
MFDLAGVLVLSVLFAAFCFLTWRAATTDAELHDIYNYLHGRPPVEGPTQ